MNRIAVITGASRGIGRATALYFASHGYDLAVSCQKNTERLDKLAAEIENLGRNCLTFIGDLGEAQTCREFFAQIKERYSHIDVLVNNAGISITGLFQEMTPEEWQQILSSNLSSVFYMSQQAALIMLPRKSGCILNVSSVWGNVGASCEVAYSATKSGVAGMTRAMAKELAPSHIRVNSAAFGAIDTDMNAWMNEEEKSALNEEIPMGRMGTVEEAAALLFQLSESPEYLTGQVITMDGGWI